MCGGQDITRVTRGTSLYFWGGEVYKLQSNAASYVHTCISSNRRIQSLYIHVHVHTYIILRLYIQMGNSIAYSTCSYN